MMLNQRLIFWRSHPNGDIILILVGIELLIDVLDFFALIVSIRYLVDIILAILDIIALFALYLFFTAGKVLNTGGTDSDVWYKFRMALIYLIIVEILYGVFMYIGDYIPTIYYWITLILPIISLILVITTAK